MLACFLNACEAGTPGRGLTGHGGWAEVFLEAGAAVVVAPSWSIETGFAARFAAHFYKVLGEGRTAGAAARDTRLTMRGEGDPDRLAYAVYASPWAQLAEPADRSRRASQF